MSRSVTLDLPDDLARRAQTIAAQTQRRMEDVLLEWLGAASTDVPVDQLTDAEVLALRDQEMSTAEQRDLSELLARQREGQLDEIARAQLDEVMGIYRRGLLRKAQALKVAVERGLQPPIS